MNKLVALLLASSVSAANAETEDNYGRDENGMYKHHQEYVKARNELNDAEGKHRQVFESINEKLTDQGLIMTQTQNAAAQ